MSTRESIKDNLVNALEAISGVIEVSTKWKTIAQVDESAMPFIMFVSAPEDRERVNSQRDTRCDWGIDIWCYLRPTDDLETWIEKVRAAIVADRGRGTYALDTFIERIVTDDQGIATPKQFFLFNVVVTYRVRE